MECGLRPRSHMGNCSMDSCNLTVGSRIKWSYLSSGFIINCLGRYARVIDQLAVQNVAQGAPLGGGSTYFAPILLSQI